ncbi:MAG: hypothetical protein GY804_08950 [Alphaproteobacteria bacterium]|nr:hypothetical protein [Alphaproteobacteria bacterium]
METLRLMAAMGTSVIFVLLGVIWGVFSRYSVIFVLLGVIWGVFSRYVETHLKEVEEILK